MTRISRETHSSYVTQSSQVITSHATHTSPFTFQTRFGKRLQNEWPRIKLLLKRYESGYVRKVASVFTRFHIRQAIQLDHNSPKWTIRKCAIVMAYCGGLRCTELRSIKMADLSFEEEGIWVQYNQVGHLKNYLILVSIIMIMNVTG